MFDNNFFTASGALGFFGRGWPWHWLSIKRGKIDPKLFINVTKTITFYPRTGNFRLYKPWQTIRKIKGGYVNAMGLGNRGFEWWCEEAKKRLRTDTPLVVSIFDKPFDLEKMAVRLNQFNLKGIEINMSCPNTGEDIFSDCLGIIESCKIVRNKSNFPIILKLSVAHDIERILPEVEDSVDAIAINSIPWSIIFPNRKSPLDRFGGGGVSGKIAQPFYQEFIRKIRDISDIPIIAPVWDIEDLISAKLNGANAFSFGSVHIQDPTWPTSLVRSLGKH